jgi:hypothetical protein
MADEAHRTHKSAVQLCDQLQQFITNIKRQLEEIKSDKTVLQRKKNLLLFGGISTIVVASVLSIPLLAITGNVFIHHLSLCFLFVSVSF